MKINEFVPNNKIFDNLKFEDDKNSIEEKKDSTSFSSRLKEKIDEVNDKQIFADNLSEQFIKGEGPDIHEVMLAGEEAKMSLEIAVQIRNKLLEAYQELNRMQL